MKLLSIVILLGIIGCSQVEPEINTVEFAVWQSVGMIYQADVTVQWTVSEQGTDVPESGTEWIYVSSAGFEWSCAKVVAPCIGATLRVQVDAEEWGLTNGTISIDGEVVASGQMGQYEELLLEWAR